MDDNEHVSCTTLHDEYILGQQKQTKVELESVPKQAYNIEG